jgi:hypothetical protein
MRTFFAAYYGRRTKPRVTGKATIDRQLADLAASPDAICACADLACVNSANKVVDASVKPIPPEMKTAMEDGEALLDEVTRCAERVEAGLPAQLP